MVSKIQQLQPKTIMIVVESGIMYSVVNSYHTVGERKLYDLLEDV